MLLRARDVILLSIAGPLVLVCATYWASRLRLLAYAFVFAFLLLSSSIAYLLIATSRGYEYHIRDAVIRPAGLAFLAAPSWKDEIQAARTRQLYQRESLHPESFLISNALDGLLDLILRDYVASWYRSISRNPIFVDSVDQTIRTALVEVKKSLTRIDLVEVLTSRIVPILTQHFKDFYEAERAVRGRHLNRNVTESEELDLAIAGKYKSGNLHRAVSLSYSDVVMVQQEYLREVTRSVMGKILPQELLTSRTVQVLIEELIACAILYPVMQMLADPDTWNQLMEAYGRSVLQDRSTVRKLRAALDEHASPAPKQQMTAFPRLGPNDNERKFEKFIRAIRKVNNLSDARRFRSEVSSQLKRDAHSGDQLYIRRLDIGKKVLDQRVTQLAIGSSQKATNVAAASKMSNDNESASPDSSLISAPLIDILHDASALSYFMEYMDRHKSMSLVQFWIVVDGFRNPLEQDWMDVAERPPALPSWSESDRLDLAQINDTYLSRPELSISSNSKSAVQEFLRAGKSATSEQYFDARRAILHSQSTTLERMQEEHLAGFRRSDLFYKCLTTEEVATNAKTAPSRNPFKASSRPVNPVRATTTQDVTNRPSLSSRVTSRIAPKRANLRRTAASSVDLTTNSKHRHPDIAASRRSEDSSQSLMAEDDEANNGDAMSNSAHSFDQDFEQHDELATPDRTVVQAMETALNTIMEDKSTEEEMRGLLHVEEPVGASDLMIWDEPSPRNSLDLVRSDSSQKDTDKPNIASLGLVNSSSRIGVFNDDDLFADEEKFLSDEHEDVADSGEPGTETEIHEAAPGDLGLAEAITVLTVDIDRLVAQSAVVESLTRKAELTNNNAELRILRKSKASMEREIRRKELQRQQYVIQESDNSLYGRSMIKIGSIMVGKEEDGREYAVYVVEVHRKAGEQMPAASWTVTRRYSEFHDLHQKLREKYPSVRNLEFPRRRMVMKLQRDFLQKRRIALEKYLRELLLLPDVCRSRDLRSFLSQSIIASETDRGELNDKKDIMTRFYNSVTDGMEDILGNLPVLDQLSVAGQTLLSAATNQLSIMPAAISEDPLSAAEAEAELNAFENKELEPFVKPICDIFLEVFELNKGNNWLRGRAVVVVLHQLLGGTIERKVRDNVKGALREESIIKYIDLLKDSMWPGGQKREGKPRSKDDKIKTRKEASLMLATLIPDLAGSVVGRSNAHAASRRIFATFNNPRLNAHLAFTLLDEVMNELTSGIRP